MAYKKKNLTPAQRSEQARKAALSVKHHNGGRKKGWTKDPSLKGIPAKTITVRDPDYQVFVKLAFAANLPIVEFMHKVAEGMKQRNPKIFSEPQEVKYVD